MTVAKVALFPAAFFCLISCSANPFDLGDPTSGPRYPIDAIKDSGGSRPLRVSDVVKALRCELTTFLVENRLRQYIVRRAQTDLNNHYVPAAFGKTPQEIYERATYVKKLSDAYHYLQIDGSSLANLTVDLKNVNALTLAFGYDWKQPSLDPKSLVSSLDLTDYHFGPSYAQTDTFEFIQSYALVQDADLGPLGNNFTIITDDQQNIYYKTLVYAKRVSDWTSAYNMPLTVNQDFYCYKNLILDVPKETDVGRDGTIVSAIADKLENLVTGTPDYDRFLQYTRVKIGGSVTLAQWLQNIATDAGNNTRSGDQSNESISLAQNEYQFVIDAKPSVSGQYTLTATYNNPILSASYTPERLSTFTFYLNAQGATAAIEAKNGNACNPNSITNIKNGDKGNNAADKIEAKMITQFGPATKNNATLKSFACPTKSQ